MFLNLGKLPTGDEVILNTDSISRIYKKAVNVANLSATPYKYMICLCDGKTLEVSLNPKDNQRFRSLLSEFEYTDSEMSNPIIKIL